MNSHEFILSLTAYKQRRHKRVNIYEGVPMPNKGKYKSVKESTIDWPELLSTLRVGESFLTHRDLSSFTAITYKLGIKLVQRRVDGKGRLMIWRVE